MRIPALLVRPPKERKSHYRKSDPQAARLYCMERLLFGAVVGTHTDHKVLRSVANHACRAAKVPLVRVQFYRKSDGVFGSCGELIRLSTTKEWPGDNLSTLLHELAHWITDRYFEDASQNHGPEFVTVYRWLLDKYRILPAYCFDEMCRRHRVERLPRIPGIFRIQKG